MFCILWFHRFSIPSKLASSKELKTANWDDPFDADSKLKKSNKESGNMVSLVYVHVNLRINRSHFKLAVDIRGLTSVSRALYFVEIISSTYYLFLDQIL